jgi:hypothetical protein
MRRKIYTNEKKTGRKGASMKERLLDVMKSTLMLVVSGLVTLILVISGLGYLGTDHLKLGNIAKAPQAPGVNRYSLEAIEGQRAYKMDSYTGKKWPVIQYKGHAVTDVEPKELEKKTVKNDSETRLETADRLQTGWRLGRDQKPVFGIDLLRPRDKEVYGVNRYQFSQEVEKERAEEVEGILKMMDRVDPELAQGKTE